ncbi:MAG: hypothetical protein QOJ54_2282 [Aliidongia sp.]|nr:hypothetical protein [Aliidongia sp.]
MRVSATLNVGALDLLHAGRTRLPPETAALAWRQMDAYVALGCRPSRICAADQTGHRPGFGDDVAWGECNAVAHSSPLAPGDRFVFFYQQCR